ncbi:G-type lectin S-receptor-like serine/threonine-protein kinase RKS1 isoform X1 [Rosa rugosa]|uniref:G-type lectin S-receptor-like serine/threonine-protein kinase RKS1 isoform X1 n=3 Tax=Rosa rugosa TaxID=74645 RepID=UPI002B40A27E|nr:G-type lectin S-receptor-like serine/threonine-protein kinase RKS1 isoform X1 [Rosa rugosa]
MNSSQYWSKITALLIFLLHLPSCISIDSITTNQTIKDGDVLVSIRKRFALGFFSPGNSGKRYVGVWYNKVPEQTIVWVANRDNPVNDTSGVLVIDGDGGLVIYGKDRTIPLWSANVTLSSPKNSMAKLLDTGNFVLFENGSQRVLWEGFDYPSNTMLPFMKIGLNRRSGFNRFLTSWKSQDDPGTGNCSYRIDPNGFPQLFLYKGRAPWWRAGSWIGHRWSGVPEMTPNFIFNVSFLNNQDELSIMYGITKDSIFSRMVLDESGIVERSTWHDQVHHWIKFWSAPVELCDNYGKCGPNSNCDPDHADKFECTCLPGFEPKLLHEWYLRDGSGGCVRAKGVSVCQNGEGFVKVSLVKAPDSSTARVNLNLGLKECEEECLRNCSCMAYSNADDLQGGNGCVTWYGDLMDTRAYTNVGQDLYVRVDSIELAKYAKKSNGSLSKKGKLAIAITSILVFFLVSSIAYCSVKMKRKGKERPNLFSFGATRSIYLENSPCRTDPDDSGLKSDLPFFDLSTISAATKNFSNSNRLGEGGFGPVYKGVLSNGTEIAVKRLCKNSGQGNEEFKNEVLLIAKLQHRNLVRMLGYCVQDEEKMLIYEYLPNKSLDSFIFNETKKAFLDWARRLEIIFGIARGILYLHQDSRLRIIHRDLKASNVLLDYDMNPKIADFGMARIFGANQIEANTNRIVGTYGYMSPEYAMEGLFSVKSDVYSFGVLLLEIITGRKNTGYYYDNPDSNLVGHVWDLWKEGRASEIIDTSLGESYPISEVLRCIQIALLCVQEYVEDRPTMSKVVSVLGNDAALPSPRKPGFLLKRSNYTSEDPNTSTGDANSINYVTCTIVEAR